MHIHTHMIFLYVNLEEMMQETGVTLTFFRFLVVLVVIHYGLQVLKINPQKKDIESFTPADFTLLGYDPHQKIEMKMAV